MQSIVPTDDIVVTEVAVLLPGTCRQTIEDTFARVRPGQTLEIVVGHDPTPLREHVARVHAGSALWTYVEQGPVAWRVRVERRA